MYTYTHIMIGLPGRRGAARSRRAAPGRRRGIRMQRLIGNNNDNTTANDNDYMICIYIYIYTYVYMYLEIPGKDLCRPLSPRDSDQRARAVRDHGQLPKSPSRTMGPDLVAFKLSKAILSLR